MWIILTDTFENRFGEIFAELNSVRFDKIIRSKENKEIEYM